MENQIVFISYSWDSEEHKKWVLDLSNELRLNGVDVILDRYYLTPGKNLPFFVETSLKRCHKIIVVLTSDYKRKALQRKGGAGYEYSLINNFLVKGIGSNEVVIPILRSGDDESSIPEFMQQYIYLDFRKNKKFKDNFHSLLKEIHNQPEFQLPDVGLTPDYIQLSEKFGHKIKVLSSHIIIDLFDSSGKTAKFRKIMKVIALQDGLNTYKEDFGVDGNGEVKEFEFSPGLVKRNNTIDGRVTYEMILDKPYKKDEEFTIELSAILINTFVDEDEHWTILSKYLCEETIVEVRFPNGKSFKSFEGLVIDGHYENLHKIQPLPIIESERVILRWRMSNVKINNRYRLTWKW